jgi:pilus assembly protein CpaE
MTNMLERKIEPSPELEPRGKGDLDNIRPIPRITIHAFCETERIAQVIELSSKDRRMSRAQVKIEAGGIPSAADHYRESSTPNLIIVESERGLGDILAGLERLAEVCDPDTKVIVIGHMNDIGIYRELIANGVSDYLVAPVSMANLMSSVSQIFADPEQGPIGKTFAFIGAKGGVGSSTICHNVAWAISNRYQSELVLADLDLAFGTANIDFDVDPPQGIAEAVYATDKLDDILFDRLLAKCAEHLNLLAAPSSLDRAYDFAAEAFDGVLEITRRSSPAVALDLPHQWSGWTRQILSVADEVVIVAAPELASLRNTKNLIDTLAELRPNDGKPRLVLNQVGVPKRPEISVVDFVKPLNIEPSAVFPFDPQLFGAAANNGQMIAMADEKNIAVENFEFLARLLTGKAEMRVEEKKKGTGLLSKLSFKRK